MDYYNHKHKNKKILSFTEGKIFKLDSSNKESQICYLIYSYASYIYVNTENLTKEFLTNIWINFLKLVK